MLLAFSIYDLTIGVEAALNSFAQIVDYLGLSSERVLVDTKGHSPRKRIPLDRLGSLDSLFSEMKKFSFHVISGEPLAATLQNASPYVCYMRLGGRDSMVIVSTRHADLQDFAERCMGGAPGKYGFGMDWNKPGSFFGYAHGCFEDFLSLGGKFGGKSDASRWGEVYDLGPTVFDHGLIRDVYPVNLLTNAHLVRETGDGTVQDFILEHKEWGGISRLADNWFLWCVPLGEIDAAREAFESRGLLKNNASGFFRQRPAS